MNRQLEDLIVKHRELTGRPFSGAFHRSLVPAHIELKRNQKQLDWDMQVCRQAMALVFIRTKAAHSPPAVVEGTDPLPIDYVEAHVIQQVPERILHKDDAIYRLASYAGLSYPPEQCLSDAVVERFDHYLGMKIVLNH